MHSSLKIALITDAYLPWKTSAAVQMKDLAEELARLGHQPVVLVPSASISGSCTLERQRGVQILRLAMPDTRGGGNLKRALAELQMSFRMYLNFRRSDLGRAKWDLVVCYSPPIFFGPLMQILGWNRVKRYLILRDIFPDWAVDLKIIRKGPAYYFLKAVANFQYYVSDVIGVQTESNVDHLPGWTRRSTTTKIEVLHNWLAPTPDVGCSISFKSTSLAGRKIFLYIGNMGVAQGMDILIALAAATRERTDLGFAFVGRGTDVDRLKRECEQKDLDNVLFFDEIDPSEIPGLIAQARVGLLALHPDHKSHNIPGKFVSYMHYGLPVLARVNADTDLLHMIASENVGRAVTGEDVGQLKRFAEEMADDAALREEMIENCKRVAGAFSSRFAAEQILRTAQ
jgi:glycosyltransferase involved in cell wall biosynthesis